MGYNAKIYRKQGGDEMVIASGGTLTIEAGATVTGLAAVVEQTAVTVTYVARSGAGGGTANGSLVDEGTLSTVGGNTYSDAAVNTVIGKLKDNIAELAAAVAQLGVDNAALLAKLNAAAVISA